MKSFFAVPVTTPPLLHGYYFCVTNFKRNITEKYTNIGWTSNELVNGEEIEYWLSESMPPELANAVKHLDFVKDEIKKAGWDRTYNRIQTILKYL